jgi:hypothetical protein
MFDLTLNFENLHYPFEICLQLFLFWTGWLLLSIARTILRQD